MTDFEFKEINENESCDPNNIVKDIPFTQANFYGKWQKNVGRDVKRFIVYKDKKEMAYFQIIKYKVILNKCYLYIPYGPITNDQSESFLIQLKIFLTKYAKENNAIFVRLDFTPNISDEILSKHFTKSPLYSYKSAYFQPRLEWYLSLKDDEKTILMNMHEKTRYSVRLSERKDIKVKTITENFLEYFDEFYLLMKATADRNGFNIHDIKYYSKIFDDLKNIKNSFLSIASYNDKILAIDLIIPFGKVANYVYGASSNDERNRMPTYLAQWNAIIYSKKIGYEYYNFGAINEESSDHRSWEGITTFKKKFGGEVVKHSDFFDIVTQPLWYHIYNLRKKFKK